MKIKINKFWSVCISLYFASFAFPSCVNFSSMVYANFILKKEGLHKNDEKKIFKRKRVGGRGGVELKVRISIITSALYFFRFET